mmetsp:Transcript_212/g.267  ORF Transcript_212/g.267 Transcript_212/m.267 type:complete len:655 (+) Transcript_212:88-2052(+)
MIGIYIFLVICVCVFLALQYCTSNGALAERFQETAQHKASRKIRFDQLQLSDRQLEVVDAFLWAWKGYKEYAWGSDELKPLSKSENNWLGLGLTLIDALDTMWIMGLQEEFEDATVWVSTKLDFNKNVGVNVFETTIRVLGGLLSAHHLSGEMVFLDKARIIGEKLSTAFLTPSSIPWSDVNLLKEQGFAPEGVSSCLSEVSTLQLEFRYLSRLTGDQTFSELASKAMDALRKARKNLSKDTNAIPPIYLDPTSGQFEFRSQTRTLGARADSYYEYLLKQWVLNGRSSDDQHLLEQYNEAVGQILKHLIKIEEKRDGSSVTFVGELDSTGRKKEPPNFKYRSKMDHLVCFLPGTLALGHFFGVPKTGHISHLELAKDILDTCMLMYNSTTTLLGPEIAWFSNGNLEIKPRDAHNILRPETVESLFYLYRITGDSIYQEWGWMIFQAFQKYCKVDTGGYAGLKDVNDRNSNQIDKMESFFLSETLKYFFLLFANDEIFPLDEYVFNTEAHPFPIHSDKLQYMVEKSEQESQSCLNEMKNDKRGETSKRISNNQHVQGSKNVGESIRSTRATPGGKQIFNDPDTQDQEALFHHRNTTVQLQRQLNDLEAEVSELKEAIVRLQNDLRVCEARGSKASFPKPGKRRRSGGHPKRRRSR